jgi:manganese/zinc/iron transport system permease protein
VVASALLPRLAAGAVIVLAGAAMFVISVLAGARSGVLFQAISRYFRNRAIGNEHLLRALFEAIEPRCSRGRELAEQLPLHAVRIAELQSKRSWSPVRLRQLIRHAQRLGLVVEYGDGGVKLTERGAIAACRVVRNHRLWEIYLIEFADRPPSRVDRDADNIEHFLGPEIVARLERLLVERFPHTDVPPSPHEIESSLETGANA